MSDLSPVLTKIAAGSTAGQQTQALGGSSAGVFANALGGGDFWSLLISQFGASLDASKGDTDKNAQNGLTNPILADAAPTDGTKSSAPVKSDNPLALLQIALSTQTLDENGNIVVTAPDVTPEKLQSQLELTNTVINHLKNVLPDDAEKEGIFAAVLGKLQNRSENLQASLSALENPVITKDTPVEEIPLPLLISLGLNPAEISEVTERIQELEEKLGRDITVEDLIAGVGGIIPPAPESAPVALAALPIKNTTNNNAPLGSLDAIDETTEPTDDLARQLNAMDVGGEDPSMEDSDEADLLNTKPKTGKDMGTSTDGTVKKDTTAFKENLVNMLNAHKANQNAASAPAMTFGDNVESLIFQQLGLAPSSALSFGATAQAANLVSSQATAGQTHPGAQMVAATLTKAGLAGEQNIMTLRLDPPELGNVQIRLEFGKDKMVKAIISAEKPETYMMLQRDSHSLERALQAAGLETNNDSLTFQLQDHGTFSRENGGRDGNDNYFGGGNAGAQDADAGDVVQSSVMWQVDPSTGHVRYNIFA